MDRAENALRLSGYHGFSIDQIARDVGIQKSSFYHHFPSKSALIVEVFGRFSEQIFGFLDHTAGEGKCAGYRLLAYIEESRSLLEEGQSICLSIALNINRDGLQRQISDDLATFHKVNIAWLAETFDLAKRDSSILDVGDSLEEARACLATVDGAQLIARAHQDVSLYDECTRMLRSRVLRTD